MRKTLLVMLLAMLSCLAASAAVGDTFTSGALTFTVLSESPAEVSVKATDASTISGAVVIPSTVTNKSITYTVTQIENRAFNGSSLITSVSIPETISFIGAYAFECCTKIKSLSIPKSVTKLGNGPFAACTSLTEILADGDTFYSKDGVLYKGENLTSIIQFPAGKSDTDFEIPSTVNIICIAAFNGCSNLRSVTIPSEVVTLEAYIFWNCTNLTKIVNLNPTPQSLTNDTFAAFNISNATLYVPSSSMGAYKAAATWNTFKAINGVDVWLDTNSATLKTGESINIKNEYLHVENVSIKSENWSSSNPDVATVNSEGVVTAVADGKATITINVVDSNNVSYSYKFNLTVDTPSGITFVTTDSKGVIDYSAAYEVFTVNGMLVGKSVESLAPGLYIVRQKAAAAKILVK